MTKKTKWRNIHALTQTMKRVLGYMLKNYKFSFCLVVVCILGSAGATLSGTLFMQSLIDDYIVPLTQAQTPDFSRLARALLAPWRAYLPSACCALTATTASWSM